MAFRFTRWNNPDVGNVAYELPPIPYGVSFDLTKLISAYANCVREGETGSETDPLEKIVAYTPNGLPDIIAKLLIQLHFDHSGIDGESLILCIGSEGDKLVKVAEAVLADLYAQLPSDWGAARREYSAMVAAERDYDLRFWRPAYEASKSDGPEIPQHINNEMERLQDKRWHAEAILLNMPAPSLSEFALKYLICFDSERDNNGYTNDLVAEAKRLLGISHEPDADELTVLLANLDWGSVQ